MIILLGKMFFCVFFNFLVVKSFFLVRRPQNILCARFIQPVVHTTPKNNEITYILRWTLSDFGWILTLYDLYPKYDFHENSLKIAIFLNFESFDLHHYWADFKKFAHKTYLRVEIRRFSMVSVPKK